jgi:two-component system response regulator
MARKILLVEDNADDAELTRLALDRHQLSSRVVHLTDGAQAIEFLFGTSDGTGGIEAGDLAFIILDLKLPKIDGLQVLERIKRDPRTRSIPVVILSSSNQERDISRSFESGVNSYVVKPVQLDDYMDKVSAVGRYWNSVNERAMEA